MVHSQEELKETMKQKLMGQLDNNELNEISLTDNQQNIYWEDKDHKEFSFKGQMFDVVRSADKNGKVILYCINDKKEEQLVDNYNSITKHNSSDNKKAKGNTGISINLFFYHKDELKMHDLLRSEKFPFFISPLINGIDNIISPPPKTA